MRICCFMQYDEPRINLLPCFIFVVPVKLFFPGNCLPVEPGIRGIFSCGIRNTAQGTRNPTNDWNPESKFHWQRLKSSTWNPESTAWNPESRTMLDPLTRSDVWLFHERLFLRTLRFPADPKSASLALWRSSGNSTFDPRLNNHKNRSE